MKRPSPWLNLRACRPVIRLVAIGFVLLMVGLRWDPFTGLTCLMRFGEELAATRLPVLRTLPLATSPHSGYDGQFYAQMAVEPDVTDPDLIAALDKPSYRLRRILLPLVAHGLGGGEPWWVLQAYALLNPAAWLVLAVMLGRWLPARDWRFTAAWLGAVLTVGALDSIRLGLTDLPAALLLVGVARAIELGRPGWAALGMLAAGLVREVALASALMVRSGPSRWRTFWLRAACTGPVLAWCAWLAWRLPGAIGHEGNIDWPGLAFVRQWLENVREVAAGDRNPLRIFGLLAAPALAAQSVYLLRAWRAFASNPWVGLGLPFAVLFWLIGPEPWLDYRAVARDCLPMIFAFNLLWARRPEASPWWLLANVPLVIDGVMRLAPP